MQEDPGIRQAEPNLFRRRTMFTDTVVIHCLVLDYFPDDVQKLREKGIRFDALDAQERRDIQEGTLKLADFGNAVHFGTVGSSSYQVTRYYRPPELLFGSTVLTPAIGNLLMFGLLPVLLMTLSRLDLCSKDVVLRIKFVQLMYYKE
ncbi:hypothetical protein COOONC_04498 [Cooperia oncophora]